MTDTATTYDIAALEALRDRVRAADGPDPVLDAQIDLVLGLSDALEDSPALSSSLDACAALQAEVLPKFECSLYTGASHCARVQNPNVHPYDHPNGDLKWDFAATMPLAWLSAILSALIAMHREAVK